MKRILPVIALVFILTSCEGVGGDSANTTVSKESTSPHTENLATTRPSHTAATVVLHPVNGSRVYGTAAFTQEADGVKVKLAVSGLTDNGDTYLTHIHQGSCPDETGNADEHEHADAEEGPDIEYPLSQVSPDSQGRGQSTTVLQGVTIDELFYSSPKNINVHAAGSGNPPSISCATIDSAWIYRRAD